MPRESEAAAISDMLQAAQTVLQYIGRKSRDDYERDRLLRHAVERNIEIIGEAARRLPDEFCARHPQIPSQPLCPNPLSFSLIVGVDLL